jgi:uncharacterized membrane protein
MTRNRLAILSLLFVAAALAASLVAAGRLPPDARLPIHWDLAGQPNSYAGKWPALLLPPGLAAIMSLVFYALPALEPRLRNFERSLGVYHWVWAAALILCASIELVDLSTAFGWGWRVDRLILATIGIMFVLIGNQLGKSRSMYLVGIRTPWTLASEEVWVRTHRLGGKLMVVCGLALMASPFLGLSVRLLLPLLTVLIALTVSVPVFYSWLLWRRERGKEGRPHPTGE